MYPCQHPLPPPDKGTTLGFTVLRAATFFALTPSPSPTAWERGARAHGAAAFLLSRSAEEGLGVRARLRNLLNFEALTNSEIPRLRLGMTSIACAKMALSFRAE